MLIDNIDRYVEYEIVAELSEQTYEITRTGDGVGYALRFEEARDDLRDIAGRALDGVPNSTVIPESVAVAAGYLRGGVRAKQSNPRSGDPSPKAAVRALSGVGTNWNERRARKTADGDAYLDGLHIGDRYIETVRPDDAPDPEPVDGDEAEGDSGRSRFNLLSR